MAENRILKRLKNLETVLGPNKPEELPAAVKIVLDRMRGIAPEETKQEGNGCEKCARK
jgi:hypothetical protein